MAGLALTGLMYGAEKIPDSWFHKVPYYRPKEDEDQKKQKRRSRRYSEADRDYEEDGPASEDHDYRRGRSRRMDAYDDEDDGYHDERHRGHARGKSVGGIRGFDGARYEPPPMGPSYNNAMRQYNPAEHAPPVVERDEYYAGRAQDIDVDGTRYVAPVVGGVAAARYMDAQRPASVASSSGPTSGGYVPYADIYDPDRQQPQKTKLQRDAERYPHAPEDQQPYQSANPYYRSPYVSDYRSTSNSTHSPASSESRRHHRERDSSRSRHKSKTRTRERARSSMRDRFDTSDKGLGYGTIGAVAGGLLGNEAGKGSILPTVAGAVIGGLGANAYESREKHKKGSRRGSKHDSRYDDRYDGRYDDRYDDRYDGGRRSSRRHPHGYDGYYSD